MKFSKHYEAVYRQLPTSWPLFINYKILKKSIRNIVAELENKGLLINIDKQSKEVTDSEDTEDERNGGKDSTHSEPLVNVNYVLNGPVHKLRPAIELSVLGEDECKRNDDNCNDRNDLDRDSDLKHILDHTFSRNVINGLLDATPKSLCCPKSVVDHLQPQNGVVSSFEAPLAKRRWTYHPVTTSKEYDEFFSHHELSNIRDRVINNRSFYTIRRRHDASSRWGPPYTSTSSAAPELGRLPASNIFPPSTTPEKSDEVRVVVPISKKVVIKRPAFLRCLSFDSIAHKRVNLRQEISLSDSFTNKSRLLVELDLESDITFLKELYSALINVADFENKYSIIATKRARDLLNQILVVATPFGGDLKHWKWLINFYIDCQIWFQRSGDVKLSEFSKESLLFFEKVSAERRKLFRRKESRDVYDDLIDLNRDLLSARFFDEINSTAIRKILKKHDRHTQLRASSAFMALVKNTNSFPTDVIRSLIFNIHESFVTIIPLPFNYTCPVCQELYWKPIRLICNHVFCVRCLAKSQAQCLHDCPLCRRKNAVATACDRNYDRALANFLKLYFPKEVREKGRIAKREKAEEESKIIKLIFFKTS